MSRKETIRILRDITRKLQDEDLFPESEFVYLERDILRPTPPQRVKEYIKSKLNL